MKLRIFALSVVALLLLTAVSGFAQDDTNLYAAGLSYNNGASPAVSGTGLYAHKVADTGTYAFTAVDVLPTNVKPFTINTSFSAGVAQRAFTIGKVAVFIPTSAGISYNGTNTGWAWTTGAMAVIPLKNNWRLLPNVRLVKSSISGGAGYQPVVGFMFGWGQ